MEDEAREIETAEATQHLLDLPQDYDILNAQWNRYWRASEGHEPWARMAKTCVEFLEGQQWTPAESALLFSEGRPEITINKIKPLFQHVMGYFRTNRYDVKFMPSHEQVGEEDISEVLNALSKQVAEMNQADWKTAEVFHDGLSTGRGFYDVRLGFNRNRLGDATEHSKDPFTILIDPEAQSYDPNSDEMGWNYFVETRWLSMNEIYMLYGPDKVLNVVSNVANVPIDTNIYDSTWLESVSPKSGFGIENFYNSRYDGTIAHHGSSFHHINRARRLVRVLDCQHKILRRVTFFMDLDTGAETIIPEGYSREKVGRILEYAQLKGMNIIVHTAVRPCIRWTVTAGDRVLHDKWSPYDRYTIIPFFPYFRRGVTRGLLHDLIDPQRELNRRRAAFLHIIMTTANSGWMYEKGTLDEDMKLALEEYGARPGINIEYERGANAPRKIEPSATPMAMKQLEMDASTDLKEISSINDSALGQLDRVQSGKAIQARQSQAILGTETIFDNFSRTNEMIGAARLHLFQRFYSEPRIIKVLGVSGSMEQHAINMRTATGEIINNVSYGAYRPVIDKTPVSASFQQAQFEEALELKREGLPIPDDILVDISSMPRKEEIKQRLKDEVRLRENDALINNASMRSQMGIPLDQPLPPVVASGQPPVQESAPQQPPQIAVPAVAPASEDNQQPVL